MDIYYVVTTVVSCVLGSLCAWVAYEKSGKQGLVICLSAIAVIVGTWGGFDWARQDPRESPLYAYLLLALLPPAVAGGWYTLAKRRQFGAVPAVLGSSVLASGIVLAVPFIAYVFQ
jgi:ABC-type spermidine/putrescine transport system permease subunit II